MTILAERRSVRTFTAEPVSDSAIAQLLDAARFAPSNSNRQAWKFLVVKNSGIKKRMADAVTRRSAEIGAALTDPEMVASFGGYARYLTFFQDAPIVIAALAKRAPSFLERLSRETGLELADRAVSAELMSVSMAIQNIQLAAHTLGLGACCMTGPCLAAAEIETILDVRAPFELTALLPIGHYETPPAAPARKDITFISEILT